MLSSPNQKHRHHHHNYPRSPNNIFDFQSNTTFSSFFHIRLIIFLAIADRANRDYQNGNYERAEHYCLQLYQQEPDNTSLLLLLSSIYFQMRRYDQ